MVGTDSDPSLTADEAGQLAMVQIFLVGLGAGAAAALLFASVASGSILATLLWRALRGGTTLKPRVWVLFAVVWTACAMFAASDEFHQSFVPSRTSSFQDVIIDICGALIGLTICIALAAPKVVKQTRA